MQAPPIATGNASAGNCSVNQSRAVSVTFSQTGSFSYAVLSGRAATSATLTTPNVTQTWNQQQPSPADHTGAAAYAFPTDSSRTFTWQVPSCYNTAAVAIAVKRLSAN
jgi:hypothetical protein